MTKSMPGIVTLVLLLAAGTGCGSTPKDTGLRANNVRESTDLMAQSLLSLPELNDDTKRWTIVAGDVEDQTTGGGRRSYQLFVDSLKTSVSKLGRGRVQLIENRDRYRQLQSKELETGERDDFGQGGGPGQPGPAGIQPDFILYAKAQDLPNRVTNFYRFEFSLTSLRNRTVVWNDAYEVNTER